VSGHENVSALDPAKVYLVRIPFGADALYAEYRASAGGILVHRANAARPVGGLLLDGNAHTETAADASLKAGQSLKARYGGRPDEVITISCEAAAGEEAVVNVTIGEATGVSRDIPINMSGVANQRLQAIGDSAGQVFPQGSVTLGGVRFDIPNQGNNIWVGAVAGGGNPLTMEVDVQRAGVREVFTLINTFWGERNAGAYASITFEGSAGAVHTVTLDGNKDVRDYLQNTWTNDINGTSTKNVFAAGTGKGKAVRLDMQTFRLPAAFATQTLTKIRISDWGALRFQRLMVSAITVR
jgi:hypothetical protein